MMDFSAMCTLRDENDQDSLRAAASRRPARGMAAGRAGQGSCGRPGASARLRLGRSLGGRKRRMGGFEPRPEEEAMIPEPIDQYLRKNHLAYEHTTHMRTVPAQRVAAAEHVSGDRVAKPVVVRIDGTLALAVVTATERV